MDPEPHETFQKLRGTVETSIAANEEIKRVAEAALRANGEQEDLRETVQRLEGLIMEQTRELARQRCEVEAFRDELRKRANGGGP